MTPSDKNPNDLEEIDSDIAAAYQALDGTIRDGHLHGFASKVLARLDTNEKGEQMDARRHTAKGSDMDPMNKAGVMAMGSNESPSNMEEATEPTPRMSREEIESDSPAQAASDATVITPNPRDENSGLHEIKALASKAKQRVSQRMTSQSEAEESLLKEATSGSFRAVALPDPTLETARPDIAPLAKTQTAKDNHGTDGDGSLAAMHSATAVPAKAAAETSSSFQPRIPEKPSKAPFFLLGGVAVVAAAAAVAVFVFDVGRGAKDPNSGSEQLAMAPAGEADESVDPASAAEPVPADVASEDLDETDNETAPEESADDSGLEAGVEGGVVGGVLGASAGDSSGTREARAKSSDKERKNDTTASKKEADKNDKKSEKADKPKEAAKTNKPTTDTKTTPDGDQDLESVLNSVTGGIDKPVVEEAKPKVPSKKSLTRQDVSTAMGRIRSSATRCYSVAQFAGNVSVKFTVDPSGKVTAAAATGSQKGTMTGDCVASAVKRAKFPPYDGKPMSFSYPFLLTE